MVGRVSFATIDYGISDFSASTKSTKIFPYCTSPHILKHHYHSTDDIVSPLALSAGTGTADTLTGRIHVAPAAPATPATPAAPATGGGAGEDV